MEMQMQMQMQMQMGLALRKEMCGDAGNAARLGERRAFMNAPGKKASASAV